jgi:hypothetical protein
MRKKGDVADLEERLTKYRSEFMIHLVSILKYVIYHTVYHTVTQSQSYFYYHVDAQ